MLLDWHLSGEDGGKVLESMRKKGWMDHIPTLVVTAEQSIETERKCIGLGAADMIRKPFDKDVVRKRVENNVSLYEHKNHMEEKVQEQNQYFLAVHATPSLIPKYSYFFIAQADSDIPYGTGRRPLHAIHLHHCPGIQDAVYHHLRLICFASLLF